MKAKIETNASISEMTFEMEQSIFKDFEKYKSKEAMLLDKWAIKKRDKEYIVNAFPLNDIINYCIKFVNDHAKLNSNNDMFAFEKYAVQEKLESFGGKDRVVKTGWFMPICFWGKMWDKYIPYQKMRNTEKIIDQKILNL